MPALVRHKVKRADKGPTQETTPNSGWDFSFFFFFSSFLFLSFFFGGGGGGGGGVRGGPPNSRLLLIPCLLRSA